MTPTTRALIQTAIERGVFDPVAHRIGADGRTLPGLGDQLVLAAVGLALLEHAGTNEPLSMRLYKRMALDGGVMKRNSLPTGHIVFHTLSINDELFDMHGPTTWDELLAKHNAGQLHARDWLSAPLGGVDGFVDVLEEAGGAIGELRALQERISDFLGGHLQGQGLDRHTHHATASKEPRRRI